MAKRASHRYNTLRLSRPPCINIMSPHPHSEAPRAKRAGTPTHPHTGLSRRPWAVPVIAWLLLVETAGLLFLAYLNFGQPVSAALLALSVLALGAAVGFARLRRGGWVN